MVQEKNVNGKVKISVVIPAYNEELGIGKVLDELQRTMPERGFTYEIIVVDDGSEDKTAEIVRERENVILIQQSPNKGYGAALKTGIKKANGEWILTIDADGTYRAADAAKLAGYLGKYDMLVGARTGKDARVQLYRRPAKWLLTKLAEYLSKTKIPDLNSGLRLFRKHDVEKYFHIIPSGFSFSTTITLAYLSDGYSVEYVPADYHERRGKSKIKPLQDGLSFVLLILRAITYFNPLRVFLPTSLMLFIAALAIFVYSAFVTGRLMDVTVVVLIVAAIQIGVFGLLADLVVKRLK